MYNTRLEGIGIELFQKIAVANYSNF